MKSFSVLLQEAINITNNQNFWDWFGDSKVVDASGKPLVIYHGSTRGGIKYASSQTSYFSSDKNVARTYSEDDYETARGNKPRIQSFYLKMINPLIVDADGAEWMSVEHNGNMMTTDEIGRLAYRGGHDGAIIQNVVDNVADEELPPSTIYITLGKKAQIKSATGNNGNFDPNDSDITH